MAKKIRFPLVMADDTEVRDLDELREHFDLESVLGYYESGKLLTWLRDRYLEDEADAVEELDKSKSEFQQRLCAIFGVDYTAPVDQEAVVRRQERLKKLRTFTDEEEFIDHIDQVAFDQEELADLLDDDVDTIYLCGKKFSIPASVRNKKYIGINDPEIVISAKEKVDFEQAGITFVGTHFGESYLSKINAPAESTQTDITCVEHRYAVRIKTYRMYSNMLTAYSVDESGRRYADVNALFVSDLFGYDERLLYVPTEEMINNGFKIISATVCGENVYFLADTEKVCRPMENDPEEAVLSNRCLLMLQVTGSVPTLIGNDISDISSYGMGRPHMIAISDGSVMITRMLVSNISKKSPSNVATIYGKIWSQLGYSVGHKVIISFIPDSERSVYLQLDGEDNAKKYWNCQYSAERSGRGRGCVIGSNNGSAYILTVREEGSSYDAFYNVTLYEVGYYTDILYRRSLSIRKPFNCRNYDDNIPKYFYIADGLFLYMFNNKDTYTLKIYKHTNLAEEGEIVLSDTYSNFSVSYVEKNPIFTVRDQKVYCQYKEGVQPTYLCDLPEYPANSNPRIVDACVADDDNHVLLKLDRGETRELCITKEEFERAELCETSKIAIRQNGDDIRIGKLDEGNSVRLILQKTE